MPTKKSSSTGSRCCALPGLSLILSLITGFTAQGVFANENTLMLPETADASVRLVVPPSRAANINTTDVLQVYVGDRDTCCQGKSPIAGRYTVERNTITFNPAFDFIRGQVYTVRTEITGASGNPVVNLEDFIVRSAKTAMAPQVAAIYPGGEVIPENTLRFYIHFSVPMHPHMSARFIKLVDASGNADTEAFMTFKQELWSEDRKRLTLLMDPGRIKRGVEQNLRLGPALLENNRYSIVVDEGWPAAAGSLQTSRFEKSFSVSPALRTLPDTQNFQITPPASDSRDALVIRFDRPFDHQLAQTAIAITDHNGHTIDGAVSIEDHEHTWRFVPDNNWHRPTLTIAVDARLEDVAGNNFIELLDHAVGTEPENVSRILVPVELMPATN